MTMLIIHNGSKIGRRSSHPRSTITGLPAGAPKNTIAIKTYATIKPYNSEIAAEKIYERECFEFLVIAIETIGGIPINALHANHIWMPLTLWLKKSHPNNPPNIPSSTSSTATEIPIDILRRFMIFSWVRPGISLHYVPGFLELFLLEQIPIDNVLEEFLPTGVVRFDFPLLEHVLFQRLETVLA